MDKYKVTLTFTEQVLGTVPKSGEVYERYIQSRANDLSDEQAGEELETIEEIEEKGWTGFHTLGGQPILYDYVLKGFFKDACGMLRRASDTKSSKLSAYKKVIDGLVFIEPRRITLELPANGEMSVLERPLRANTAQGERVTLARSDVCPEGTRMSFQVTVLGQVKEPLLREWLDYGALRGLGQWRNAGWGRFGYEMEKL